jgi:hypothetical protein
MFSDLELTGLDFDSSMLEAYLYACLAIAGLMFLFNKITSSSPYGSDQGTDRSLLRVAAPLPAPAVPSPGVSGHGDKEAGEKRPSTPARRSAAPRDRRSSLRRGGKPVKVLLSDPEAVESPLVCWVIDRSRGGLGLVSPQLLPVGAVREIRAAHAPDDTPPIRVEVCTCRRRGHRWKAGCKFTAEIPWITLLLFG